MAGTISISGLGSGMDINGIVDALVNAASMPKVQLQNRLVLTNNASTSISDISSLLSKLKTSVDALSTPEKSQSYAASSSNSAISASITTSTSAARYSVNVEDLAQEYRAYSNAQTSSSVALGQTGQMSIQVGTNNATAIDITGTDSLDSIVTKINQAGLGVTASTLFDGSNYRMQLRGVDSGTNNTVTVTGLDLGLNAVGNFKQQAQDAHITVDGFDVYSHSNVVSGAIPGVTLTLSSETTSPVDISVKSDPSTIKSKIQSFVDAYNAVVRKVHTTAGYGSVAASDKLLSGNSALRDVTSRMSNTVRSVVESGSETYTTLYSLGIRSGSDGTLTLDSTKLDKAISSTPDTVTKILAGTTSGDGVMDLISTLVKSFTNSTDGLLTNQTNTLKANATRINSRIDAFDDRMSKYEARLRAQFSNMDSLVSSANATMTYLSSLSGS